MSNTDDDWDGGGSDSDLDITAKQRAPSPSTMHKIYKIKPSVRHAAKEEQTNNQRSVPYFMCQIDDVLPSQIVLAHPRKTATSGAAPPLTDVTVEIDNDMSLRVLYNGVLQCRWRLSRRNEVFEAQSYEWSDDSRVLFQTFVNEFTGEKEFGYGSDFYGQDIFYKKWRTIGTAAIEALVPTGYKQYSHQKTFN